MKSKPLDAALRLLSQREQAEAELTDKLLRKGYAPAVVAETVADCKRLDLQSDARYVDMLCRARIRQGYGPLRIQQELLTKKIPVALIENALQAEADNWLAYAEAVWHKKWKHAPIVPGLDLQKKQRFMLYRGFSMETIIQLIQTIKSDR